MALRVTAIGRQRLHAMRRADFLAEGLRPLLGLAGWRWPRPLGGLHRTASGAFARHWDASHPVDGLRWRDDPEVAVLSFEVER